CVDTVPVASFWGERGQGLPARARWDHGEAVLQRQVMLGSGCRIAPRPGVSSRPALWVGAASDVIGHEDGRALTKRDCTCLLCFPCDALPCIAMAPTSVRNVVEKLRRATDIRPGRCSGDRVGSVPAEEPPRANAIAVCTDE